MKTIDCVYAILDVKKGRGHIRNRIEKNKEKIPVLLTGVVDTVSSQDDGVSQEFSLTVLHVVETANTIAAGGDQYDRAKSLELREEVIALRDAALDQGKMVIAVTLSHVIAWMAVVIEGRWSTPPENSPKGE